MVGGTGFSNLCGPRCAPWRAKRGHAAPLFQLVVTKTIHLPATADTPALGRQRASALSDKRPDTVGELGRSSWRGAV